MSEESPAAESQSAWCRIGGPHCPIVGFLDWLVPVIVLVAVLLHPTQVTVRQWADLVTSTLGLGASLAARVPAVNVTLSDALLLGGFVLWFIASARQGRLLAQLRRYPLPLVGLLLVALLSVPELLKPGMLRMTATVDHARAAKQIVQLVIFFVCAYMMLADYLSRPQWRERLLAAFLVAVAVALLVGLVEYAGLRPPSAEARQGGALISASALDGTFGFEREAAGAHEQVGTASNRCVLGAWVTLVLPLLWAVFLFGRHAALRIGALVASLVAGLLLLHAGLWVAALLAVLALSLGRGRVAFALTAVGALVFYGLVFTVAPQEHGRILLDSVMLRSETDAFRTLPLYEINPELAASGQGADLTQAPYVPWQQKYAEWQPALVMAAHSPLFGVGLGNYQSHVGQFYTPREYIEYAMPKSAGVNLMETGANPFYAVWLAETGFVGLLGFVWLMGSFLQRAARGAGKDAPQGSSARLADAMGGWRTLKRAACAALGAAAIGCLFTDYWVRGVGIAFVFVLALAAAPPEAEGKEETPE